MNKQRVKAADTTAVGMDQEKKVKGKKVASKSGQRAYKAEKVSTEEKYQTAKQVKEPPYTFTHVEVENSKPVAYHITNRRGTRYRVEKSIMIEMAASGVVKGITVREVAGNTQVVGIGKSVGLYPSILNITKWPSRVGRAKKDQDVVEQEVNPVVEKKSSDQKNGVGKSKDKSIILEVSVSDGSVSSKGKKKKQDQEVELVY